MLLSGIGGAPLHGGFDRAQAGSVPNQARRAADRVRRSGSAPYVEGNHRTETAELGGRQLMAGVAGQAGIAHAFDCRVDRKPCSEAAGIFLRPLEPQRQGPDAPGGEPGLQRARRGATQGP